MALLNVARMVVISQTCFNCYYNSNFLARQELRGAQIIGSEIIETRDKTFPKVRTFSEVHHGHPHENISNLSKIYFQTKGAIPEKED